MLEIFFDKIGRIKYSVINDIDTDMAHPEWWAWFFPEKQGER